MRTTRFLALAALLALPLTALAHAHPESMAPAAGSTVKAPTEVRMRFSETLEPALSTLEVDNAAGKRLDQGHASIATDDAHIMHLALPPLPAGSYKVRWTAVSTDGHRTRGTYAFAVK